MERCCTIGIEFDLAASKSLCGATGKTALGSLDTSGMELSTRRTCGLGIGFCKWTVLIGRSCCFSIRLSLCLAGPTDLLEPGKKEQGLCRASLNGA